MSFSINTNVTSLQAQTNLRNSADFQAKTINRVTSGLRIVNSGDDAAGLAIANGFRSDQSVLTQGIRNANDGLSTLQTIDGGMNNISMLLDRARTLATQSASGTFSGSRDVLNSEFQSVLTEIDRQSTAIGMNTGGQFAKSMSVFIGGGKDAGGVAANVIQNGSVFLDLSKSTVDNQSLGMKGFAVGNTLPYNLASGPTSVENILADATNKAAPGLTTFDLAGAGFPAIPITLNVNTSNVQDTTSLVAAANNAIQAAEATGNSAFKAANIVAQITTAANGSQQLQFSSSNTAFQVTATSPMANALMGNFALPSPPAALPTPTGAAAGAALSSFVAGGTQQIASEPFTTIVSPDQQVLTFTALDSTGAPRTAVATIAGAAAPGTNASAAAAAINAALQGTDDPALKQIVAVADSTGTTITFAGSSSSKFTTTFGAATTGGVGFTGPDVNKIITSGVIGTGGTADVSNQASAASAVSALATAVTALGAAQANVGKAENQFNYAMNLAQSQTTNLAAAESRIRDADLASEAANLTKAQILIQAGTAALAQANSAPQAILTLLK